MKAINPYLLLLGLVICFVQGALAQTIDEYFARGNQAFKNKDYVEADKNYTECLRLEPKDVSCRWNRGLARQIGVGYGLALEDYTALIQQNPVMTKAYNQRGGVYNSLKRYDEAIADFNRAIQLDPNFSEAFYNRGRAYDEKEDKEKALVDYSKAISINPKEYLALLFRASIYRNNKENDKALSDYTQIIAIKPDYGSAYYNRGKIYFEQDKKDLAEADFKRAVEIDPSIEVQVRALKTIESTKKTLERFKNLNLDSIALPSQNASPGSAPVTTPVKPVQPQPAVQPSQSSSNTPAKTGLQMFEEARQVYWSKDYKKAILLFNEAESKYKKSELYFFRGVSNRETGNLDAAIADFTTVLKSEPKIGFYYFSRAETYIRKEEYTKAINDYSQAILLKEDLAYAKRGNAYLKIGDYAKAIPDLSKAIINYPDSKDNYVNRARAYCQLKNYAAAAKDEDKAISMGVKLQSRCKQ